MLSGAEQSGASAKKKFQFLALEIKHHFIYILVRSDDKTPAVLIGTKAKNISKEYAI